MNQRSRIRITIFTSLAILVLGVLWTVISFSYVGGGPGWTEERDVEAIRGQHFHALIDPATFELDGNLLLNWMKAESRARALIAFGSWSVVTVALVVWTLLGRKQTAITRGSRAKPTL